MNYYKVFVLWDDQTNLQQYIHLKCNAISKLTTLFKSLIVITDCQPVATTIRYTIMHNCCYNIMHVFIVYRISHNLSWQPAAIFASYCYCKFHA